MSNNPFNDIAEDMAEATSTIQASITRTIVEKARIGYHPASYLIEVRHGHGVDIIERSYDNFVDLRDSLKLEFPSAPTPSLPIAQASRFNGGLGEERAPMLNEFLQVSISESHPYSKSKGLAEFFKPNYADLLAHNKVRLIHEGFLMKKGHNVKNWKKRWFVLKAHESNGQLSLAYFKVSLEDRWVSWCPWRTALGTNQSCSCTTHSILCNTLYNTNFFKDPRDTQPAGVLYLKKSVIIRDPDSGECFVVEDATQSIVQSSVEKNYVLCCAVDHGGKEKWLGTIRGAVAGEEPKPAEVPEISIDTGPYLSVPIPTRSRSRRNTLFTPRVVAVDIEGDVVEEGERRERSYTEATRVSKVAAERIIDQGEWPVDPATGLPTLEFLDLSETVREDIVCGLLDKLEDEQGITELKRRWLRDIYLGILVDSGLVITEVPSHDNDEIFVLVYTPMTLLCKTAERMSLRKLVQPGNEEIDKHEYSTPFQTHNYIAYSGYTHPSSFFSSSQRSLITRTVLSDAVFRRPSVLNQKELGCLTVYCPCFGKHEVSHRMEMFETLAKGGEVVEMERLDDEEEGEEEEDKNQRQQRRPKYGLNTLVMEGIITSAYPLHTEAPDARIEEESTENKNTVNSDTYNPKTLISRTSLIKTWAKGRFRRQPLENIREYFGPKIALYFAWLEYYTLMLIVPAVLGIITVIVGAVQGSESGGSGGVSWDGPLTIPYAILMAVWATLFLELWKRKNAELAYKWGTMDFEQTETIRPGFHGEWKKSPVTGEMELYYPSWRRKVKFLIGSWSIATLLVCVVAAAIGVLTFRITYQDSGIEYKIYAGAINAVVIMIMNVVYGTECSIVVLYTFYSLYTTDNVGILARRLTDWENHRTETEYEDQLIAKTFLFQFINSYITLFYIAFFKGSATFWTAFGVHKRDTCTPDCLSELTIQLASLFVSKIVIDNLVEVLVPYAKYRISTWVELRGASGKTPVLAQWEREAKLPEYEGTFGDYSEMIIQFGYVTLFVAAFPLAPLAALLNNVVELRSDALKLLIGHRRPPALLAQDIGTWYTFLNMISIIAVITNTLLISFTSSQLYIQSICASPDCIVWWKLWVFIILEHGIIAAKYLIAVVVPDTPEWVDVAVKRDEHRAERGRRMEELRRALNSDNLDNAAVECYDPDNRASFKSVAEILLHLHTEEIERTKNLKKEREVTLFLLQMDQYTSWLTDHLSLALPLSNDATCNKQTIETISSPSFLDILAETVGKGLYETPQSTFSSDTTMLNKIRNNLAVVNACRAAFENFPHISGRALAIGSEKELILFLSFFKELYEEKSNLMEQEEAAESVQISRHDLMYMQHAVKEMELENKFLKLRVDEMEAQISSPHATSDSKDYKHQLDIAIEENDALHQQIRGVKKRVEDEVARHERCKFELDRFRVMVEESEQKIEQLLAENIKNDDHVAPTTSKGSSPVASTRRITIENSTQTYAYPIKSNSEVEECRLRVSELLEKCDKQSISELVMKQSIEIFKRRMVTWSIGSTSILTCIVTVGLIWVSKFHNYT